MLELDRINLGLVHEHNFDEATGVYTLHRAYGMGSNILVAIHGLAKVISQGHRPKKIVFKPAEYFTGLNIHHMLFEPIEKAISQETAASLVRDLYPTAFGLSNNWQGFDKRLVESHLPALQSLMHYFSPNWHVKDQMLKIFAAESMDLARTTFIWARGTDKAKELDLPTADDYIKLARKIAPTNMMIVQTDDMTIAKIFKADSSVKLLNQLPLADNKGFHNNLHKITDIDFIKSNGITKLDYLSRFMALVFLAAQCKVFVGYPGNLTTLIPILRGTFDGCYLFKNATQLV
jgi:hypothetical protein